MAPIIYNLKTADQRLIGLQNEMSNQIKGTSEEISKIKLLNKIVTQIFLSPNYSLSSCIGHNYLYQNLKTDCILYPSIALKQRTVCYAFHPNMIDEKKIIPQLFNFIKIVEIDHILEKVMVEVLMIGFPNMENETIRWVNYDPQYEKYKINDINSQLEIPLTQV